MFPKKGKVFPGENDRENGTTTYAMMIADALRTELGDTHRAAKTIMRWTGANERTVKHWLSGRHGPSGDYLIALMSESEAVFETVLVAACRHDAVVAARILEAHATIGELMAMVEKGRIGPTYGTFLGAEVHRGEAITGPDDGENDRINDRQISELRDDLNSRQRWYLERLALGETVNSADLQRRWNVSETTARRDLAALKARGMIKFVGPFRTGHYRLTG